MFLQNFTLLYVEDDKNIQEDMKEILEPEVKTFYQAYNGEEGLALYKEKDPDIIVTDINMPIMSGLNMASAIKKLDRTKSIIIISAFDEKNILLDALNIGIDGFVVKPVDIGLLLEKLEQIAQNMQNQIDVQIAKEKALKEKEQRLYTIAHYDTLTNIPNSFLFKQKLIQTIHQAKEKKYTNALLFIDLDNFKIINDTYGHKAGDFMLKNVVKNIQKVIRNSDFFARMGGDEFAILVENISRKECLEILSKKIIKASRTPVVFDENTLHVSCSIGISICTNGDKEREDLIHQADLAMYQVKANGKSGYVFYDELCK